MKLLDLHLRAYGPFTDRHLDLSAGREGLHIVFGRNEAGKSSALRALRALLFGISARTRDDFVHGKSELRIGGRFQGPDGDELLCYRRKGRKNTLLDAQDQPIDERKLSHLLGGVDERVFERLFGIDHASLVSGGQALLEERGREAEALFGTGLGSTAVHSVLERLDQDAQALFAPRALKPLINAALSTFAERERQLRDASLSARQWDEARKAVNTTKHRLEQIDGELAEATRRRGALERLRRTLPGLAKRAQIHQRLAELGEVPLLTDDFEQRHEQAVSKGRLAEEGRLKSSLRLDDLRGKAAMLEVSADLLAQAETIDDLREQLGSYRKAKRDRPDLAARQSALADQARQRLAQIRPNLPLADVEQVRPLLGKRRRSTELGGRREALEAAVEKTRFEGAQSEKALEAKREGLDQLPPSFPLEGLQQAVEAAQSAGNIDSAIVEAHAHLRQHEEACSRDLASLGMWAGNLAHLLAAPLPGDESVRRFREAYQKFEDERRRLEQLCQEARSEQQRTEESLRALRLGGAVPSEAELEAARRRRDDGWQLLRRQWLAGEDVTTEAQIYGDGAPLAEAFASSMTTADDVSDRLRRESQRVHERATAQAKLEACQQRLSECGAALQRIAGETDALEQSWQEIWRPCGLAPLPPREMQDWLDRALRLREKTLRCDELRERLEDLQRNRETHKRNLRAALGAIDESEPEGANGNALTAALKHAQARLLALENLARRRTRLHEDIAALEDSMRRSELALTSAQSQYSAWQSQWAALMAELGLAEATSPGEVSDYLQTIADILQLADEAAGIKRRVDGIDIDALRFETDAKELLIRLAGDLSERPIVEAVFQLHARLVRQREARSRLDELQRQARRADQEVQEGQAEIRTAQALLRELCREGGCESPEELKAIEQRHKEHQSLRNDLRAIEHELLESGDGLGIEALEAEAGAVERDIVLTELTTVNDRIETELQPQREQTLASKVNAERDFTAMAGDDEASALAEEVQQTLASIRALAQRYVRIRLASRLLRDEIERFRAQHRDPILSRASRYFEELTCDSFATVQTNFDDSDQPVLVGVRPSGERLRVEAMSTGTRDQLYLALRLATLEHYLDNSESLPFIVDDILIQFDDERARATLESLARFSRKTQVILFTHHRRDVELGTKLERAETGVTLHELDRA